MPAPVVTRLISVTYAGLTVGGTSDYQLTGIHVGEVEYGQRSVEFDVVVRDATTAACQTLAAALEAAFRKPDQDLRVTIDSVDFLNVTQAANTGMNARATCRLIEGFRSKKSRLYRCTVVVQLPADLTGKNGRQSASWSVSADHVGIRTLTVRATYTALPGVGAASVVANANFNGTYVPAIQSALGGAWEEAVEVAIDRDDNDKLATATATYRELVHEQSGSGTNDTRIVGAQYHITTYRQAQAQLSGSNATEPVAVTVAFDMGIRVSSTQDLKAMAEDVVVPYLTTLVSNYSDSPSAPVLMEKNVQLDPTNNRIRGTATFLSFETSLVRASLRMHKYESVGNHFAIVADGNPFSRDLHPSPARRLLQLTMITIELASAAASGEDLTQTAFNDAKQQATSAGYFLMEAEEASEEFERRLPGGNDSVRFLERVRVAMFEYAELATIAQPQAEGTGFGNFDDLGISSAGI